MVFGHGKFLLVSLSVAVIFMCSFFTFTKPDGIPVIPMVSGSHISKHSTFVENMQKGENWHVGSGSLYRYLSPACYP